MRFTFGILTLINATILLSCSNVQVKTSNDYEAVELPDGSIALLNHNSSISYAKIFEKRNIEQTGEVYYEVEKKNTPFSVHTPNGEVTVLGTEFNVKSDEDDLEVEVESGSVEVKINNLVREIEEGQKAAFNKLGKEIKVLEAELQHDQWLNDLETELDKLGNDIIKESKKVGKVINKETEKIEKEVKKDIKDLKSKLKE